jgi:dephospho-CoA kinase
MLRVGLTGGIACGKSTVAAILRECGIIVIEADLLAHKLIEPGCAAYDDVVREFGKGVLNAEGMVDRAKLGAIVFANPSKLERLNQIVHPHVIDAAEHRMAELARQGGPAAVAVVEAALLIEAGYAERFDRLIVVWCRPEQQRERLLARGLTPAQVDQRIAAQMPIEQKRRLATDEIDCSGSLESTRQQVERLAANLKQFAAA